MFFKNHSKEIAQLREDLNILATRVQAFAKVTAEILEMFKQIKEAPHGYKKDGTPKQKPGWKTQ